MTCTRADVRSCTRGQHLSSHRRVACVLANLRRPCRRAVQTYIFHTPSLQHLGMPSLEYTLACGCGTPHLVTLDALLASKHQFRARSHGARLWPRVVFPRGQVGPRKLVHWCSKAASVLRPETGLVSWSRIWTKFSAYCIFTYNPHLGPFSDLTTWSIFWPQNLGRFWSSANHFSRTRVSRVVYGSRRT